MQVMSSFSFPGWNNKLVAVLKLHTSFLISCTRKGWVSVATSNHSGRGTKTGWNLLQRPMGGWPSKLMAVVFLSGGDVWWKGRKERLLHLVASMVSCFNSAHVSCCLIMPSAGAFCCCRRWQDVWHEHYICGAFFLKKNCAYGFDLLWNNLEAL